MSAQIDAIYRERNQLVAALTKLFPAVRYFDGVWSAVYLELPTGQVSWHYAERDADLFRHLPMVTKSPWDGHDTPTKYARLNALPACEVPA